MKQLVAVALLVLTPSIPRPSGACSPVEDDYGPHELDPASSTDAIAPSAVDLTYDVYRASGGGGGCDSCGGGFSGISLTVSATDDRTIGDQMGYRFEIVGGQPPPRLLFPTEDRRAAYGYSFNWRFDNKYRGAFSFDVEVRAVDLNGNLGPATVVTIAD